MTTMLDLTPAAEALTQLVDGVSDDQLDAPTPCADYTVATLLDHLVGLTLAFRWAALSGRDPSWTPQASRRQEGPVR